MDQHSGRRNFLRNLALSGAVVGTAGSLGAQEKTGDKALEIRVPRRTLGKTGAEVSILGLGLGSVFTRPFSGDPEKTEEILDRALSYGINYWDTARSYGPSEETIGPMVGKNRKQIFLVSKSAERDYDGFKRQLEESLTNLKTDHIDLYHIHNLNPRKDNLEEIEKGAFRAVLEAKEQGIIKHYGITGHSGTAILIGAIERFNPDCLLTVFPVDRPEDGAYEEQLLPIARQRKMGVIAMKTVRWARNADLPGPQLVRYAMSLEGITTAIVGLDSLAHLEENATMAANFKAMPKDLMAEMSGYVKGELAKLGQAPWNRPGYDDTATAWG